MHICDSYSSDVIHKHHTMYIYTGPSWVLSCLVAYLQVLMHSVESTVCIESSIIKILYTYHGVACDPLISSENHNVLNNENIESFDLKTNEILEWNSICTWNSSNKTPVIRIAWESTNNNYLLIQWQSISSSNKMSRIVEAHLPTICTGTCSIAPTSPNAKAHHLLLFQWYTM